MAAADALEAVIARGNRNHDLAELAAGRGYGPNWFLLNDDTIISVVAGDATYCTPRQRYGPFTAVEVWLPEDDEPKSMDVEELRAYVAARGGVVAVAASRPELSR